jgi:hypothetical protein
MYSFKILTHNGRVLLQFTVCGFKWTGQRKSMVFTTVWSVSTNLSEDSLFYLGPFASFRRDARTTRQGITKGVVQERCTRSQPHGSASHFHLRYGCKLAGLPRTFAAAAFGNSKSNCQAYCKMNTKWGPGRMKRHVSRA